MLLQHLGYYEKSVYICRKSIEITVLACKIEYSIEL